MANVNKDVSRSVKAYFEDHKISISKVAEMMHCSQQAVSGQLSGRPIGRNVAKRYADLFGFDMNYLITGVGTLFPGGEKEQPKPEIKSEGVYIPAETLQMYKDMAQSIRLLSEMLNSQRLDTLPKGGASYLDNRRFK